MDNEMPLCAGNWKAHGDRALLKKWAKGMSGATGEVLVCVPHPLLLPAVEELAGIASVGAQDVASHGPANYTGNTTASHVADCGVGWTLVGHSERRAMGETDADAAAKIAQAEQAGLRTVLCIGETLEQRKAGLLGQVLETQLSGALPDGAPQHLVVAYEPVWAIGTGVAASAQEAQDACGLVQELLAKYSDGARIRTLYGGSVKPDNAAELMAQKDIDGLLVGGASLDPEAFFQISQIVASSS